MNKTLKVILIRVAAFSTLFLVCFLPLCGLFSGCASPDGMVDQGQGRQNPSVTPGGPSTGAQAGLTPVGSQPDPGAVVPPPGGSGGGGSGGGSGGGGTGGSVLGGLDGGAAGGTGGGVGGTAGMAMVGSDAGSPMGMEAGRVEAGQTDVQKPLVCNYTNCAMKASCEKSKGCSCGLYDPTAHSMDGSCINANICDYCNIINSFKVVESHKYTNEFGSGTAVTLSWDVNGGTYFRIGKNAVCGGDGPLCAVYTGTVRTASFNITVNTTFWLQVARNQADMAGLGYASVTVPVL